MLRSAATARLGDAAAGPSTCRAGRFSLVPARRSHLGCGRSHRYAAYAMRYPAVSSSAVRRSSHSTVAAWGQNRDGMDSIQTRLTREHRRPNANRRTSNATSRPPHLGASGSRCGLRSQWNRRAEGTPRNDRMPSAMPREAANSLGSSQSPPITLRRFEHPHCRVDHRLAPTRAWRHLCKPPPEASVPRLRSVQSSPSLESWLYSHGSSPVLP